MNEYLYDTTYDPPIPVCNVTLIAPATDRRVKLTAIVDTGADGTIVPIRYLEDIGARRAFEARLRSQWGEQRTVFLYVIDLQIGETALTGVYVVGDDLGDEVVLGRDVLNQLDGPAAMMKLFNAGIF